MPLSKDDFTVFVVDADPVARDALTLALGYRGYCVRQFSSRADFLAACARGWRGCVVANLEAADGGLDFLNQAKGRRSTDLPMPVVLTGELTSIEVVRRAFLAGAVDVLPKSAANDELLAAIERAMQLARDRYAAETARPAPRQPAAAPLTRRELEVATLVRQGFDNRSVGDRLGISHRTVEVHKTRLMRKLGVRSLAGLIALPSVAVARRKTLRSS